MRKNTKKILAGALMISMMLTALVLPALADNTGSSMEGTAATLQARGGRNQGGPQGRMPGNGQNGNGPQGQMPGMPGNNQNGNGPQGQMPGMPGNSQNGNGAQGQMPGMPENNQTEPQAPDSITSSTPNAQNPNSEPNDSAADPQAQTPDSGTNSAADPQAQTPDSGSVKLPKDNRKQAPNGRGGRQMNGHEMKGRVDFQAMVTAGILDQETVDKIEEYIRNNTPQAKNAPAPGAGDGTVPADTAPQEPSEGNPEEGSNSPEQPAAGDALPEDDLMAKLVEAGILTQEQADAIQAAAQAAEVLDTASADTETADTAADSSAL